MKQWKLRLPAFRFRTQLMLNNLVFALVLSICLIAGYGNMLRQTIMEQNSSMMAYAAQEIAKSLRATLQEYSSIAQQNSLSDYAAGQALSLVWNDDHTEAVLSDLRNILAARYIGYIDSVRLHTAQSADVKRYMQVLRLNSEGCIIGPLQQDERNQKVFPIYTEFHKANAAQAVMLEMRVYETVLLELLSHVVPQYDTFITYEGIMMTSSVRGCVGCTTDALPQPYATLVSSPDQAQPLSSWALFGSGAGAAYATGSAQVKAWNVITCVDYSTLMDEFRRKVPSLLYLALVAVALNCSLHLLSSRRMNHKMQILYQKMTALSNGDFQAQILIPGRDEFSELALALNRAGNQIASLIQQNYRMNEDKAAAQMQMLRSQINEHFLINALGSIKWLVIAHQGPTALEGIDVLSSYLRISLRTREDLIPVLTEIGHIRNYVYFLQLRYRDRLQVSYDIPEETLDGLQTLRFILQPFMENAVSHAWRADADFLRIDIRCRLTENRLVFQIEDNGVGMEKEIVDAILQGDESKVSGYGIRNVMHRLAYVFDVNACVSMKSTVGQGTLVEIVQPKIQRTSESK